MSSANRGPDPARMRQGRIVALVIAGAGIIAILAPWLVQVLGLQARFEFLFYLASLGAFVWALVVALRMLRSDNNQR